MLFNRDLDGGNLSLLQAKDDLKTMKRIDKRGKLQFLKFTPRRDVNASRKQWRTS